MLLAILVDGEAFKRQIPARAEIRGYIAGPENGALDGSRLDAVLDEVELDGDGSCDFNRAAEANLSITLAEMEIAD